MEASVLKAALESAESRLQWVESVTRYFAAHELYYGHGTETAADEAHWLIWQLSETPEDLAAIAPDEALIPKIIDLATRRVEKRVPLAYLLGTAWFSGLEFKVSDAVLIPRSPLAELIERRFEPWATLTAGERVLEIGTGSGCIAIATAVHHPDLFVDATEIDPAALAVATSNVERHDVGDRLQLIEADLFPGGDGRYRVIISNPPYVPTSDLASLPAEYGYEPEEAFDGGADGLDVVRRILEGARRRLTDDGILLVEVGLSQDALLEAYPQVQWTWLEFERGGEGVFLLTADDLDNGWG